MQMVSQLKPASLAGLLLVGWSGLQAAQITESFDLDPQQRGWRVAGDASLFHWNEPRGALEVTWDSRQPNSYFYRPLGTILTKRDDFHLEFDLRLDDIQVGINPDRPYTFELALGFLNLAQATSPGFLRGSGTNSPNVVEWNYYPDSGFGATVAAALISAQNQWGPFLFLFHEVAPDAPHRFGLDYRASDQRLTLTMSVEGTLVDQAAVTLPASLDDFRVDTLAVSNYNDAGQDPLFGGSVLAHGTVDNLEATLPPPPISDFSGRRLEAGWEARWVGQVGWRYSLEASVNLLGWQAVGEVVNGTGQPQTLVVPPPLSAFQFYRLRADRD